MKKTLTVLALSCIVYACNDPRSSDCNFSDLVQDLDSCNRLDYKTEEFNIVLLDVHQMPYIDGYGTISPRPFKDNDSIPMLNVDGVNYYHPVYLAQYGLEVLDVFTTTQDSSYIEEMEKIARKLFEISETRGSVLLFPYPFDFCLHDCTSETMTSPWYSSMAQGQVLSYSCRLYSLTGDSSYLEKSHHIFNSFLPLKGEKAGIWISCVDDVGNLWLEEYPNHVPSHTLNGMIFSMYGIYDYYYLTKSKTAEKILKGTLSTIKNNIHLFRNPNGASYYTSKNRFIAEEYHAIHINQLNTLFSMTRDSAFFNAAGQFTADFSTE